MLHEFLAARREEIIARTQTRVVARAVLRATEVELVYGVPLFFGQLVESLRRAESSRDDMHLSATKHGDEMLRLGFTVAQVVYDYGDLCQAVTELAFELKASITAEEFQMLNRCVYDAIAQAVTEYGRLREKSLSDQGTERLGFLAHEVRNQLSTAILSFDLLKSVEVSIRGRTGALLDRSLKGLTVLIDRSLGEVRLESTEQHRERIVLAEFMEEVEVAAVIEAKSRGLSLTVDPIDYGIAIDADRPLLGAAVTNLLQNAFKFTTQHGSVRLRAHAVAGRVLIDVEDECGGLPAGKLERLFQPYHQRGVDRTGLGLGLSISRRSAQLNGGEIRVRDLPGVGCVFTVDLPRSAAAAMSS